ncbi:MAG TPA: hypothetical protein VD905_03735 [Flavobacteriales bacterium]|nr:hypothetical protein [Flavobacteriales bacterium]
MQRCILLFLLLAGIQGLSKAQKKLLVRDFNPSQKAQWDAFVENWKSNGGGTCMPMMETQIDSAKCTKFAFTATITVGSDGIITKVKVLRNAIQCEIKPVAKEIMDCFIETLCMDLNMPLTELKGKTILKAEF